MHKLYRICIRHADEVCGIGEIKRHYRKAYAYKNNKTGQILVSVSPHRDRYKKDWERIE